MSERYDAIVIGAGCNGLAAAILMARAGRRTLVLERAEVVGVRTAMVEFAPGFCTPTLGLQAGWLPPRAMKALGIEAPPVARADLPLSVTIERGACLSIDGDAARAADMIRSFSEEDAKRWPAFTARLRRLAGFLEVLYQSPAPDVGASGFDGMTQLAGLGWKFRQLGRDSMTDLLRTLPMSVEELLDDTFEFGPLKAAVATGGIQSLRQGPRSGGTAFNLLHHLVGAPVGSVRSRGFWRDGPDALVRVLENAAAAAGVTIRTSAGVERIEIRDDRVSGVVLESGEEIEADCVLSSADPARTMLGMIDPVWLDPELLLAFRNIRFRGCTAFVLYALDDLPAFDGRTDTGRILSGIVSMTPEMQALERASDAGKYGEIPELPHVELTASTLRWPDLAPSGKHVLVARATSASYTLRDGLAWDTALRDSFADSVTKAIERHSPGFAYRILHRSMVAPPDIEARLGCTEGAFTHGEMMLDQILFMRPVAGCGDHAMPVAGLYLCGSGTHPGPSVPGGAGWLAARRALTPTGRR